MSTILIIEDNQMNLEIAEELLKKAGHKIIKTENASDGLKLAKFKSPDLILMDLSLPGMDGLTATKVLKQDHITKNIPVIAFTASVMQNSKIKAFGAGCSGFISKPIDVLSFASTVEKYLNPNFDKFKMTKTNENIICSEQNFTTNLNNIEKESYSKYKWHKILIIEDNSMNAEILKETLEQMGQSSIVVNRGKDALEIVEKETFDLILLDVIMPEMSGFDVIKSLKSNPKTSEIPVVFVSALAEIDDILKGFDLGSYDYITKPYDIRELKAKILSILRIKDLQDQLMTEKKKFDLIFKFSADGIILLNSAFEIVSCNDKFSKWLNLPNEEIIGQNFCKIIGCQYHYYKECLKQLSGAADFENHCTEFTLDINGKNRCIHINLSKVNENELEIEGYVLILRDITAFREIEKQKETFVATLTHDLKTPIRAEMRALELLLKGNFGKLEDEQTSIIKDTLCSSKYMFNMVNNLLCTYQNESGNIILHKDNTDINKLIKICHNEYKQLVEDKNQQVIFDFKQDTLLINVDALEIKRVITNLLSNAINYSFENSKIIIKTDIINNNASISITDNGKGIPQKDIKELFKKYTSFAKRFRQVGTGLGLYLSKQIIDAHGGKIWVESQENKGSTFTFEIPLNIN